MAKKNGSPAGLSKEIFTTGDAAKACGVSQQTIIRCFDDGLLKGFRVPGSKFRRIPRDNLYKFMRENGIPTDALGMNGDGMENGRTEIAQSTSETNGAPESSPSVPKIGPLQTVRMELLRLRGMIDNMLTEVGEDSAQAS